MNNAIKIRDVGDLLPLSRCRGGMTFMQTIAGYVSVLGYAYALHFSILDGPSKNFNPLQLFTPKHA